MVSFDWLRQAKRDWAIPEIIPERCVHQLCEVASCTRCVDSCPQAAWMLDESGLRINTALCDSCGLCVAACPQQALVQSFYPLAGVINHNKSMLMACERVDGFRAGKGVIPCLHSFSLGTISEYYQLGYHHFYVTCDDCTQCERGNKLSTLQQSIQVLNQLLSSRNAPLVVLTQVDAKTLQRYRKQLEAVQADQAAMSRRQFFRQAATLVVETVEQGEAVADSLTPTSQSWIGRLPASEQEGVLFPYVPTIDTECCNGCDACVQLCPQQALTLDKNDAVLTYQVHPERCNDCRICVDGCDQQAMQLVPLQPQPTPIELKSGKCKACGSPYHYPHNQTSQEYCRICAKKNHHRMLFQVY